MPRFPLFPGGAIYAPEIAPDLVTSSIVTEPTAMGAIQDRMVGSSEACPLVGNEIIPTDSTPNSHLQLNLQAYALVGTSALVCSYLLGAVKLNVDILQQLLGLQARACNLSWSKVLEFFDGVIVPAYA